MDSSWAHTTGAVGHRAGDRCDGRPAGAMPPRPGRPLHGPPWQAEHPVDSRIYRTSRAVPSGGPVNVHAYCF